MLTQSVITVRIKLVRGSQRCSDWLWPLTTSYVPFGQEAMHPAGRRRIRADRPAERAARTIRQQCLRRLKDMPRCFLENSCKGLD